MKLREIAHARTGDKGNILNIALIAYRERDYAMLEEQVTAERVGALFTSLIARPVECYCVPGLGAMNFVLHRPPMESVTRSLNLDAHGKSLGFALLNMEIEPREPQKL